MVASDRYTPAGRIPPSARHVPRHAAGNKRPGRRSGWARTALVLGVVAVVAGVSAALVTKLTGATTPAAASGAVTTPPAPATTITISPTGTGATLTGNAVGLSFEASDLLLPSFTSGNLSGYLRSLGTSVIRIGGNTVDQTFWTSSGEKPPSWSIGTITDGDLAALKTLTRASGWKIVLGLNLKHFDPERAADEAEHASAALGSSLLAVEIGNEPDRYPQYKNDPAKYVDDFQAYVTAIRAAVPGVPIDGTDAAFPDRALQQGFVAAQASLAQPQIQSLTSHYYPLVATSCHGTPTMAALLGADVYAHEVTAAEHAAAQGRKLGVPAVIDESNNVVCEGEKNISDVFAAALWELDMQLLAAQAGIAGDYQHGTVLRCDSPKPLFMYYTPLCAGTDADTQAGLLTAQPEFYGLAAVRAVGTGAFLRVTNPVEATIRAYAVKHADGTVTVVLDDVEDPTRAVPVTLRLDVGAAYGSLRRVDLTAKSLTARSGVTLGGQVVQADGSVPAPTASTSPVRDGVAVVTIQPGSAALLTFSLGS
jgi:hypothetical protein